MKVKVSHVNIVEQVQQDELLEYHKKHIGNRYIEVLSSSVNEKRRMGHRLISADGAIGGGEFGGDGSQDAGITLTNGRSVGPDVLLKARGLPFDTNETQIADKFQEYNIEASHVLIEKHTHGARVGQTSGNCYLIFEDRDTRDRCLLDKQGCTLGTRYLELFEGGRRDDFYGGSSGSHGGPRDTYHDRGNHSNAMGGGGTFVVPNVEAEGAPEENDEEVVKLRGLPFRSTKRDVVNFFEPEFMIEAQQVFICMEERTGRPSGQALVKMLSSADAADAVKCLDRKHMEERYIEVSQGKGRRDRGNRRTGGPPYDTAMNHRGAYGGGKGGNYHVGGQGMGGGGMGGRDRGGGLYSWLRLRGLPFSCDATDIVNFLNWSYGVKPENDVIIERHFDGKATGQAFVKVHMAGPGDPFAPPGTRLQSAYLLTHLLPPAPFIVQSTDDVMDAMNRFHNKSMGSRYIEVYKSSSEEVGRRIGGSSGGN
eukprot:g8763.t1